MPSDSELREEWHTWLVAALRHQASVDDGASPVGDRVGAVLRSIADRVETMGADAFDWPETPGELRDAAYNALRAWGEARRKATESQDAMLAIVPNGTPKWRAAYDVNQRDIYARLDRERYAATIADRIAAQAADDGTGRAGET